MTQSAVAAAAGKAAPVQGNGAAAPSGITAEAWAAMTPEVRAQVSAAISSARPMGKITLRVSTKGALSLYGLGRWPVTLYASQWRAVLAQATAIEAYLRENAGKLSSEKPSN